MITLGINTDTGSCSLALARGKGVLAVQQCADEGADGGIPWNALVRFIHNAGLVPSAVTAVAISGRFTPLWLRRYPNARQALRPKATSPLFIAAARAYEALGWSGLATVGEDRVAAWYESMFRTQGFSNAMLRMVHTDHALVSAAYVYQSDPDVDVLVAHPRGDGPPVQAYSVRSGQIRRRPVGGSSYPRLRTWFECAVTQCGFDPWSELDAFWKEAEFGEPDDDIVGQLRAEMTGQTRGFLSKTLGNLPEKTASASVALAMASVLADVATADGGSCDAVIMGRLVGAPYLRGLLRQRIQTIQFSPFGVSLDLAVGAAAYVAGTHPFRDVGWFNGHSNIETVGDVSKFCTNQYGVFSAGEYAVHRLIPGPELPETMDKDTVIVLDRGLRAGGAVRVDAETVDILPKHLSGMVTVRDISKIRDGANARALTALLTKHRNHVILETRPIPEFVSLEQAQMLSTREGIQGLMVAGCWIETNV